MLSSTELISKHDMNAKPCTTPQLLSGAGQRAMRLAREPTALLSGVLRIIHPEQYQAAQQITDAVLGAELCQEALDTWGAVCFHGLSLIANRQTPAHRDPLTNLCCFDIMTSVGSFREARMKLSHMGVDINIRPGMVIALLGKVVRHEVACIGERLCWAFYARDGLYERFGIRAPPWMTQSFYVADERWLRPLPSLFQAPVD